MSAEMRRDSRESYQTQRSKRLLLVLGSVEKWNKFSTFNIGNRHFLTYIKVMETFDKEKQEGNTRSSDVHTARCNPNQTSSQNFMSRFCTSSNR
jgi:hypothetical protein